MSEPIKITREELYKELWQTPLSKLAVTWGVPIAKIVKAAGEMEVPRPEMGYWQRVQLGQIIERPQLPARSQEVPEMVEIQASEKREPSEKKTAPSSTIDPPKKPELVIPDNLDNAHKLVKQTRRALTHDTYLHLGLLQSRTHPRPLHVEVAPESLDRALRIMDYIVKAVIEMGGRFQNGPESWRWCVMMGKQETWFWLTEVKKRFAVDPELNEEERSAKGLYRWDKYEWKGSGLLRFKLGGDQYMNERVWTETKQANLVEYLPEILECLKKAEAEGVKNRQKEVERKKVEAERQRLADIEWRRQYEENERRKSLVEASECWQKAENLRHFVRVCERELCQTSASPETPATIWLDWARAHADRLDPIKQGYLRNLVKASTT